MSALTVSLLLGDVRHAAAEAPRAGDAAVAFDAPCPACGAKAPILVAGCGTHTTTHDTFVASAKHVGCGERIGRIEAKVDTIFGIEEDERVLHGRARVY